MKRHQVRGFARLCPLALPRHIRANMCNLYSLTKGQAAIRDWFRARRDPTGNLPLFPGIFPDQFAPIALGGDLSASPQQMQERLAERAARQSRWMKIGVIAAVIGANHVGVLRGFVSAYSQNDVAGTTQRRFLPNHPRQCGLFKLRMFVTGWPPNCGMPHRAMTSSRSPSAPLRTALGHLAGRGF